MDQTLTHEEAAPTTSRRSRRPQRWLGLGTLLAAALMLVSLVLPLATDDAGTGPSTTLRFVDLSARLDTSEVTPFFPAALVDFKKFPFPGPGLILVLSLVVALAGLVVLTSPTSQPWPRSRPDSVLLVLGGLAAALVGFGEAIASLALFPERLDEGLWDLQIGPAPFVLLVASLLAFGLLSQAIIHGDSRFGSRTSAWEVVGFTAWMVFAGLVVLVALAAAGLLGEDDGQANISALVFHEPLLVVVAVAAPTVMLAGRTAARRLRAVLVWLTAALSVATVVLVVSVMISAEIAYLD